MSAERLGITKEGGAALVIHDLFGRLGEKAWPELEKIIGAEATKALIDGFSQTWRSTESVRGTEIAAKAELPWADKAAAEPKPLEEAR